MARLSQDPANLAPFIITPRARTQARRVQSANTNAQRPNTVEREIGNESVVGISFDSPDVTLPVDANLVNARLISLFANYDPAHTWNDKSVQDMLGQADVDVLMMQRNTARTAWLQSVYVRQATVGSYRIQAATNASATETFELTADNKTAFERFIQVDNQAAASSNQATYTLSNTAIPLTRGQYSGNYLVSAQMATPSGSSTYLLENDEFVVVGSGTIVSITNSTILSQIATGTQFAFSYQRSGGTTPDPFTAKDTTSPAAIRGYYHIPVTITANSPNGMQVKGMQSVDATMNFNAQSEEGMGSQKVGSWRQTPPDVTGNFTVFSENFDLEKLMIAGTTTSSDTDYPIDAFRNDIALKLEFKHPDTHQVLRIDVISGLTITGDVKDVAVGQQVGKQYSFTNSLNTTWYVSKLV